jgi:hypothetical protein
MEIIEKFDSSVLMLLLLLKSYFSWSRIVTYTYQY